MEREELIIVVREYDAETDRSAAEAVDRICEVGTSGKVSLCMDLLGDPVSRIRHSPAYLMLVTFSPFLYMPSCSVNSILFLTRADVSFVGS